MKKVVQSPYRVASSEMIAKLIRAGYLKPARRHDADAITKAIAQWTAPRFDRTSSVAR